MAEFSLLPSSVSGSGLFWAGTLLVVGVRYGTWIGSDRIDYIPVCYFLHAGGFPGAMGGFLLSFFLSFLSCGVAGKTTLRRLLTRLFLPAYDGGLLYFPSRLSALCMEDDVLEKVYWDNRMGSAGGYGWSWSGYGMLEYPA